MVGTLEAFLVGILLTAGSFTALAVAGLVQGQTFTATSKGIRWDNALFRDFVRVLRWVLVVALFGIAAFVAGPGVNSGLGQFCAGVLLVGWFKIIGDLPVILLVRYGVDLSRPSKPPGGGTRGPRDGRGR